ncbi:hypothetical protein D1610_14390 [Sphingomonas gilva]|uniref:Type I secretion protein TolC n=1 Tax=Sphingomonas gilva TaxID=2305907 RepID=A0A396RSW3_9SPHN|nr:hypothetical protein D1610_14390 [Sphingomonas gilva]
MAATGPVSTLREALVKAYNGNPTLSGARAQVRATDENVPIARAAGLPSIGATADFDNNIISDSNSLASPDRSLRAGVNLSVPLFQGGLVRNSVNAAEARVLAARQGLRGTESDLFTDVVSAYMDVIRDESIVQLNQQNVRVLEVNLQATQDRFEVGDLTRTDVAQSEARLAIARGQLRGAEAGLISSRENYVRLVGDAPGTLTPPPPLPNMPDAPTTAVDVALTENPFLGAARQQADATRYDVGVARASRLPRISAVVGGNYTNYLGSLGDDTGVNVGQSGTAASGGLSLTLPLFQGGEPAARVRQAQALRSQALEQVTETERSVIANVRAAYSSWRSALAVIESSQVAVDANRLSLEGVRAENSVGNRTILDILNAEQELLNSQVTLVTARRDAYVAGFALLAAMGRAEANDLGLDGGPLYDPVANYDRVRGKIWDWDDDPAPRPIAPPTTGTRPQSAVVGPIEDPALDRPVDTAPYDPAGTAAP